jgi:hypothetical protein
MTSFRSRRFRLYRYSGSAWRLHFLRSSFAGIVQSHYYYRNAVGWSGRRVGWRIVDSFSNRSWRLLRGEWVMEC